MKRRLIFISILFSIAVILSVSIFFVRSRNENDKDDIRSQQILAVNELEQLALKGELEQVSEKSAALQEKLRATENGPGADNNYFFLGAVCIVYLWGIFGYIYICILKPFDKMKLFTEEIAKGNFEMPLKYERSNYFGDFTWAFDSMRKEITKSRICEKQAIENNKTVIATLSHDIKTPIASIRAYAEGLEANMDSSAEKRQKYISVIMKKCDEVSNLTNDLFLHSVSDLDKLKIVMEQLELCKFLREAVWEISAQYNDIHMIIPDEEIMVYVDKNRLMQVCENLITNAGKYAKTRIDVTAVRKGRYAEIFFRDYGRGIPDEDMPFIFSKFYRGKNCGQEPGSGLGLYIVKYIVKKMKGEVLLHNMPDGLEAVVKLPILPKS